MKVLALFGLLEIQKNQPINTILDSETLEHSSEWQSTPLSSVHGPTFNPSFLIELAMEQQAHILFLKT